MKRCISTLRQIGNNFPCLVRIIILKSDDVNVYSIEINGFQHLKLRTFYVNTQIMNAWKVMLPKQRIQSTSWNLENGFRCVQLFRFPIDSVDMTGVVVRHDS